MSEQRFLTEYEINDILSFLKPQKGIPIKTAMSVYNNNFNSLSNQLKGQKIYPEMIDKLKIAIERQFETSKIVAGESVGVLSAQSIGEGNTQSTLNTFHSCGSADSTVLTGVPRVEELLNATKDPKYISCTVHMKDNHESISDLRKTIGYDMVEITFSKITESYNIIMDKEYEPWYESFKILYNDKFTQYTDCISIKLNMDVLYEYKLDVNTISEILSLEYEDLACVFSPDNIGQLDVFINTSDIDIKSLPENRLDFINSDNIKDIYLDEIVQPILSNIIICGIPGIKNIYFNDTINVIETSGSNFKKLLGIDFIDNTKTISNNVWDIYNTLGIEAARQCLINEFKSLCSINTCHIQLLSEKMTYTGNITSISRYTMRAGDCGPMGKASFEETMDNFLKAGIYGQVDDTNGVSASILCGKRARIGTGVCDLVMNLKALPDNKHILNDYITENNDIPINPSFDIDDIPSFDDKRVIKKDTYIKLTEKDFKHCNKIKANIYLGHTEMSEDDKIIFTYDSKTPKKATLRWKNGIKVKKEIFEGFDKKNKVYIPLEGIELTEQGRFMCIVSLINNIDDDDIQQNSYSTF